MSGYVSNNIYFYSISEENMKILWQDTSAYSFISGFSSKFPVPNWDKFKDEYNRTFTWRGWLGRKVTVVPRILWHGVILTIYRLVGVLITKTGLISSYDFKFIVWHNKQPFYLLARDLQLTVLYVYSFFFDRSAKWYIDAVNLEKLRYTYNEKYDSFFICVREYCNHYGNDDKTLNDIVNLYHIMIQSYGDGMKDNLDCVRFLQLHQEQIVPLLIDRIAKSSTYDYKKQFGYLMEALIPKDEVENTLMQVIGNYVNRLSDFSEEIKKSFFISWLDKASIFTKNTKGDLRNQVFAYIFKIISKDLEKDLLSEVINHFLISCYNQMGTSRGVVYMGDDHVDISVANFVNEDPKLFQSLLNELESKKFKDQHFINLIKKLSKVETNEQLQSCCVARAKRRYREELERIIEAKLNPQQETKKIKSLSDLIPTVPIPKGIDELAEKIVNAIMEARKENGKPFSIEKDIAGLCEDNSTLKNVLTQIFSQQDSVLEIFAVQDLLKIEGL